MNFKYLKGRTHLFKGTFFLDLSISGFKASANDISLPELVTVGKLPSVVSVCLRIVTISGYYKV